jgi:hypothetical protein
MGYREIAIYATLHCNDLDDVESILSAAVAGRSRPLRIEQGTVLLYEGSTLELSVDRQGGWFYLSGRYKADLREATCLLQKVAHAFAQQGIAVDIEYQEEDEACKATSACLKIATGTVLPPP